MHYYFNDPSARPQHHRFDRGSYVYLYHNATQQQSKLEVANHAGTPDQDAFSGFLDVASLRYSYNQPTLLSISIGTTSVTDTSSWHIASYDEKNEAKFMYKLHAVDIYCWTAKAASTLLANLRKVLTPDQMDIRDAPASKTSAPEHRNSVSPVVQQLERTAIGANIPPRTDSALSAQSIPSAVSTRASSHAAPVGYNPAAPAAPEPIAHREKTPPPFDAEGGTGLAAAAKFDHVPPAGYQGPGQTPSSVPFFAGPPQQAQPPSAPSFPGPPLGPQRTYSGGAPQQQSTPSFGPLAQSTIPSSSPPAQQPFQAQYTSYPAQTQQAKYPGSPGFNPPTPSAPPAYNDQNSSQSSSFPPPPPSSGGQYQSQPESQHPPPVGGYSNYTYNTTQSQQAGDVNTHGAYVGDMHQQLYRPTLDEAASGHGHGSTPIPARRKTNQPAPQSAPPVGDFRPPPPSTDGQPVRIQDSAKRLEGKVSKYLNKLDNLW